MAERDTIFALSSGQLPAAIAVIRVSGSRALDAARAITTRDLPPERTAALRRFIDPRSGEVLDEALLIYFAGPRTETGEDVLELQCHGSRAVVRALEEVLGGLPGLRRAEPGEFTRRSFLNGKIDLAGIEGLGDLIAAETSMQRQAALAMLGGGLSRLIADWTERLRRVAAQVEAQLDFSDEGDVVESGAPEEVLRSVALIEAEMAAEFAKPSATRLKEGLRIAIGGPPNAGKSSLFNMLIGREGAIVSPHAGTTRDVIEANVAFRGIPFIIADSAGLREAQEDVERIGITRAEALLAQADIMLWLGDPEARPETAAVVIQLAAKSDLPDIAMPAGAIAVSSTTGAGLSALVDRICNDASRLLPPVGEYALSERQRSILARARDALGDLTRTKDEVLVGEGLRQALAALDELTGRSSTEALLDELFSGFCIGK